MSAIERLERQLKLKREQAPPPAPSPLGEALEAIIRQQVEERVAEQMEKQKPYQNPRVPMHLQPFTDKAPSSTFPPPPPTTKEPRDMTVLLQRDKNGRAQRVTIGSVNFTIERDSQGRALRMVQTED